MPTPNGTPDAGGSRIPALDGIRGLAILMVLICHFSLYGGMEPSTQLGWIVKQTAQTLGYGVELFFVLSGFLITGILLDTKSRRGYFRSFYMRRILRIFPLFYGALVLFYIVLPRIMPPGPQFAVVLSQQWWDWAYLSNIRLGLHGWPDVQYLGHFWSLAIEEQFYLVWPLLALVLARRRFLALCGVLLAFSVTVRLGQWLDGDPMVRGYLTHARLDPLVAGAALAAVARGPRGLAPLRPWAWLAGGVSLLILTHWLTSDADADPALLWPRLLIQTLFAVLFGSLLILTVTATSGSMLHRTFTCRPLMFLGTYSYGLYVFHHPLMVYAGSHGFGAQLFPTMWGSQLPGLAIFGLSVGALSIALALGSYHLYEKRFLKLKRRFRPGAETTPPSAVAGRAVNHGLRS